MCWGTRSPTKDIAHKLTPSLQASLYILEVGSNVTSSFMLFRSHNCRFEFRCSECTSIGQA